MGVNVVYSDKSTSNGNKVIRYRGNWDDKKTGGAIYAGKNNQQSMGQIEIKSLAGAMITLLGFDLVSAGTNRNRTSAWKIEDLVDGMILNKSGMIGVSGVTKVTTQYSSTSGFKITWGHNAFKVGLDNLSYSITSIPEPGPLALFGIGLLGLTVMRKKIA